MSPMPPPPSATTTLKQQQQEALGAQIKKLREERDISQTDLGLMLAKYQSDNEPVPQTTISRWEVGVAALTPAQVNDLERAFKLKLGTLLIAAGYVEAAGPTQAGDDEQLLYEVIRRSTVIHPELRSDVQAAVRSYIATSKRLAKRDESLSRLRG